MTPETAELISYGIKMTALVACFLIFFWPFGGGDGK